MNGRYQFVVFVDSWFVGAKHFPFFTNQIINCVYEHKYWMSEEKETIDMVKMFKKDEVTW
jgi:glutamate racemase